MTTTEREVSVDVCNGVFVGDSAIVISGNTPVTITNCHFYDQIPRWWMVRRWWQILRAFQALAAT